MTHYSILSLFNPLTAGAVYIRFLHFILAHYVSAFNPDKSDINQQDLHFFTSIMSNLNNFYSLEVVDRVSETHLQVGQNSN